MTVMIAVLSLVVILGVLYEAFETMLLPRRVARSFRLTRFFYVNSWRLWTGVARLIGPARRRGTFLSYFGPLSLLVLLSVWAVALIAGFALLHWSIGTPLNIAGGVWPDVGLYAYFSGVTFFTLGYGDITPIGPLGRALAVLETGIGFGFLAVVIGYLPVLYQAFSRREVTINLFDARAGSPPTAGTLLARNARYGDLEVLANLLRGVGALGGRGAGEPHLVPRPELLPLPARQPVVGGRPHGHPRRVGAGRLERARAVRTQAYLTFAMARHVAVDICQTVCTPPVEPPEDRLPPEGFRACASSSASPASSWPMAATPRRGWPSCAGCTSRSSMPCRCDS